MFQFETGNLCEDSDHRRLPILFIIVLNHFDRLPVLIGEVLDPFRRLHILHPFRTPILRISQKTVVIYVEGLSLKLNSGHVSSLLPYYKYFFRYVAVALS